MLLVNGTSEGVTCNRAVCGQPSFFSRCNALTAPLSSARPVARAWNLALRLTSSAFGQQKAPEATSQLEDRKEDTIKEMDLCVQMGQAWHNQTSQLCSEWSLDRSPSLPAQHYQKQKLNTTKNKKLKHAEVDVVQRLFVQQHALVCVLDELVEATGSTTVSDTLVDGMIENVSMMRSGYPSRIFKHQKAFSYRNPVPPRRVAPLETLEAMVLRLLPLPHPAQESMSSLHSQRGVPSFGGCSRQSAPGHKVVWPEWLSERFCVEAVHGSWLEVHENRAGVRRTARCRRLLKRTRTSSTDGVHHAPRGEENSTTHPRRSTRTSALMCCWLEAHCRCGQRTLQ